MVRKKALFPQDLQELLGQQVSPALLRADLHAQVGTSSRRDDKR